MIIESDRKLIFNLITTLKKKKKGKRADEKCELDGWSAGAMSWL